jgi:hypothetical protein
VRGDPEVEKVAASVGLTNGRLITFSKSRYRDTYPDHFVLFNATIANGEGRRLWWGDIDATLDEEKLSALARALEERLFVLFEHDAQLVTIEAPWQTAALVAEPAGEIALTCRWGIVREGETGRIVRPPRTDDGHEARTEDTHAEATND